MKKLPVKAKLITRNGFSKNIDLPELIPVVTIPIINAIRLHQSITDTPQITAIEFYLQDHKIVSEDTLKYIAAIYEEM